MKGHFKKIKRLGEGTFGVVFKAKNLETGEIIALKKIQMDEEGVPSTSIREIANLKSVSHENIVKLDQILYKGNKLYLIFEYLPADLRVFMDLLTETLELRLLKKFLYQLLQAISHCHSNRILHRDLKPQNLLLDENYNLKIADFGLSKTFSLPLKPATREVVTLWYRAPELLLGCETYGTPIDVWSIGCIFAEMVTNEPLFQGDSEIDQLFQIFSLLGTPTEETCHFLYNLPFFQPTFPRWKRQELGKTLPLDPRGLDLLERMLELDPFRRISAESALAHSFFK